MNKRAILGAIAHRAFARYVRDAMRYRQLNGRAQLALSFRDMFPVLRDFDTEAGIADPHYFYQDLWAARLIYKRRPRVHIDIGSRIDGFVAHLLTFMPVTVMDVRSLTTSVEGLTFVQADATQLKGIADGSVDSLSSLHAIEHFGLGRYGDPIDPDAPFKVIKSMARVLAPGGRLYLSVPIGRERVEFNAHRVFDPFTILEACNLTPLSFAAIDDERTFQDPAEPRDFRAARYACGLFEFTS